MIDKNEFTARRLAFLESMAEDSAALLSSGSLLELSQGVYYPFEVNRDFFYLTGVDRPDCSLLITKSGGESKEFLFIPPFEPAKAKWYGNRLTLEEASKISGIKNVLLNGALATRLDSFLGALDFSFHSLYLGIDKNGSQKERKAFEEQSIQLRKLYPSLLVISCNQMVRDLRYRKSKSEIEDIAEAIGVVKLALRSSSSKLRTGINERELCSQYKYVAAISSEDNLPFEPIFASGERALLGIYERPNKDIKKDELIVATVGAKYDHYCAKSVRTYPVSGRFDDLQKTIYRIMVECFEAMKSFVRPGTTFRDLKSFAEEYIGSECYAKNIFPTKEEINQYFFRPVGHFIGLDCFDPVGDENSEINLGSTFFMGLSLSFPNWGFCLAIGDTLLLGEKGGESIAEEPDIKVEDIENFFAAK